MRWVVRDASFDEVNAPNGSAKSSGVPCLIDIWTQAIGQSPHRARSPSGWQTGKRQKMRSTDGNRCQFPRVSFAQQLGESLNSNKPTMSLRAAAISVDARCDSAALRLAAAKMLTLLQPDRIWPHLSRYYFFLREPAVSDCEFCADSQCYEKVKLRSPHVRNKID